MSQCPVVFLCCLDCFAKTRNPWEKLISALNCVEEVTISYKLWTEMSRKRISENTNNYVELKMLNTECKNDCNRSELKGIGEGKVNGVGTARGEQWQLDREEQDRNGKQKLSGKGQRRKVGVRGGLLLWEAEELQIRRSKDANECRGGR